MDEAAWAKQNAIRSFDTALDTGDVYVLNQLLLTDGIGFVSSVADQISYPRKAEIVRLAVETTIGMRRHPRSTEAEYAYGCRHATAHDAWFVVVKDAATSAVVTELHLLGRTLVGHPKTEAAARAQHDQHIGDNWVRMTPTDAARTAGVRVVAPRQGRSADPTTAAATTNADNAT